jgi:hypothetical protein
VSGIGKAASPVPPRRASRETLTAEMRAWLARDTSPRVVVLAIVILAGGCAFLFSVAALRAGLVSMGLRYAAASIVGYVAFVLLIRVWIAYRRNSFNHPDFDLGGLDPSGVAPVRAPAGVLFTEGGSGGGGAGTCWDAGTADGYSSAPAVGKIAARVGAPPGRGSGVDVPFDLDDLALVLLAAVLAACGAAAILYVVYVAPALLAEVALDAALVSSVYRRLRRRDLGHWGTTVLRRTWAPAVIMIVFMSGAGYVLQHVAPDARSLGDIVRAGLRGL